MYFLVAYGAEAEDARELMSIHDGYLLRVPMNTKFLIYGTRDDWDGIHELETKVTPLLQGEDPEKLNLVFEPDQVFVVVALRRGRGKNRRYVLVLLTPATQRSFSFQQGDVIRVVTVASSAEEAKTIFERTKASILAFFRDRQQAVGIDPPINHETIHPALRALLRPLT